MSEESVGTADSQQEIAELKASLAELRREFDEFRLESARRHEELLGLLRNAQPVSGTDPSPAYQELIRQIRLKVQESVPADAKIIVISKGDAELIKFTGSRGQHFPQNENGEYPGYYPASSLVAISQLETLRSRGMTHLVIPASSLWWLEYYTDFARHLRNRYRLVSIDPEVCAIYALTEMPQRDPDAPVSQLERLVDEFSTRFDREPTIVDWSSGLPIAGVISKEFVMEAPESAGTLPYVDGSVDIVAVGHCDDAHVQEASRVASAAVVYAAPGEKSLKINWKVDSPSRTLPSVSIIIPVHNGVQLTTECLVSLQQTLPSHLDVQIVVVDDASSDATAERLAEFASRDSRIHVVSNPSNMGFLHSANRGAAASRGEILLFLNNDTIALPGWLPPMLRLLRDNPDAGAVGGKLLFPDGRLQEAGGIIFSDGSAAHFGRGENDPGKGLFNYVREVDYCSGAMLATRRSLFEKLRGFDAHFAPAYYEDTDYCFRVRSAGFRVYFQPASMIVHLEGASCGKDLSKGVKRYQVINEKKFVERWRSELATHPARPGNLDAVNWMNLANRPVVSEARRP